jgi:NitT/TauT family transport system substrate-binding protein
MKSPLSPLVLRRRNALALGAGLALGWPATQAQTQRKVALALWSKPITEIAHLLAEEEKGFFRAQGLDLQLLPGAGGGDAVRNLLSGQADIAFTDPGSLFTALDKGEKLHVIYDIYPQNVFNVVALNSSGITRAADLKGKRVGVYSLASGTRQNLQLLLAQAGLKESDITLVVTGLLNFAPLIQGQVDATAATDTGLAVARQRGLRDVHVIEVRDALPLTSDVLVVREETLQQHKPMLRAFVRAWRDSVQWSITNPEQAALQAQKKAIDGQNLALNREVIRLRNLSSVSAYTQRHGLGAVDIDSLQKGAQAYQAVGLISRVPDMRAVVATDILP